MIGGRKRNVLLITADQWRGDTLGHAGHPLIKTPVLDVLAAEGVSFRRHYSQAAPCGPARASLWTGLYMMNHRSVANGTPLDARHTNLALEVRKAGFDPTLFGYTDTSVDPRTVPPADPRTRSYEGVLPGFTAGLVMREDGEPWRAFLRRKGYGNLDYPDVYRPAEGPEYEESGATYAPARYKAEHSDSAFMVDHAIDWLAMRRGEDWFCHLSLLRPHPPWVAPAPYHALYRAEDVPPPARPGGRQEAGAVHPLQAWFIENETRSAFFPDRPAEPVSFASEADVLQARATYYGLATEVDDLLGRLFQALRDFDQWEDTLVIFTSDHGEQLGDHFRFGKRGYNQPAFHVPLIVRGPGIAAGRTVEAFTEAVDLMPTVLDYLGLTVPAACDGYSLLPFLQGSEPQHWRRAARWEYDFRDKPELCAALGLSGAPDLCSLAVQRGERFMSVFGPGLPPALFDLHREGEDRNLAGDPAFQADLLAETQAMLRWRMAHAERTLANHLIGPEGFQVTLPARWPL